jgi:hypothetical protein
MKNISTGFGLCVAAAAALAYPFVSSLAPSANASAVTAAASAVGAAATAQTGPTIVWYAVVPGFNNGTSNSLPGIKHIFRAWSDGRIEVTSGQYENVSGCQKWVTTSGNNFYPLCNQWSVVSDPAQGLTYRSDINFDEKVDGADLGALLADWGDAPRHDIPPSDCPLNLVNP